MTATLQIKKDRPNYYILIRYKDGLTEKERQKWIIANVFQIIFPHFTEKPPNMPSISFHIHSF